MDEDRRRLLTRFLPELVGRNIAGFSTGLQDARIQADLDAFFSDYDSSYALTLAYPDEILIETARKEGIPVDGQEKIDIVRNLFIKKGGYGYR